MSITELALEFQTTGISLTQMAKREGTSRQTLAKKFKELGIEIINKQNRTKFNENIFDSIDTEEKAYWLGFIYADGSISSIENKPKPKYTLEVSLKGSDIEHLHKLSKFMECEEDKIKLSNAKCQGKSFKRCRFAITNKHLWKTLNNYGCTPRKSLTLKFPDIDIFKNNSLIRHFIRGYFDGDGCFTRQIHTHIVSPAISMLGTPEFIYAIKNYINIDSCLGHDKRHTDRTIILEFCKNNGIEFINYLYQNSTVYLNRKYKLFEFFKNGSRSVQEWAELQSGNIGEIPEKENPEINSEIKESESSYSVESEPYDYYDIETLESKACS